MQPGFSIDEAQQLRDTLSRYKRESQRFLEVLVHDVRAHQRGINTSAELLAHELGDQLSVQARQVFDQLQDEVKRVNALLAAVGSYSDTLIESRYSMRPIPLEVPIQFAVSELSAMIRETGATVTYGALPQVLGDPARLTCLFRHLITNAVSYRSGAAPCIDIQATSESGRCVVSVRDNGIGIAPEYADKLFVPFFRLHGAEIPGAGLGLAACKNIVEAHGGTIWLASKVCDGTTFFFTLPPAGISG
jgi:two-component system, chemotaxis family, sensor kinase Cph1